MLHNKKLTVGELISKGVDILKKEEIDSYMIDCQLLLAKVLRKDRLFIMTNRNHIIDDDSANKYMDYIELRRKKMPIKYILGYCEFMGLDFKVREGVLIPRPDTEILVEVAIEEVKRKNYKTVCDVCCGSGIIGICISKYVESTQVDCFDIDSIPQSVTSENIALNGVCDRVNVNESDLLNYAIKNKKQYDIIVSNPPYIKDDVIPTLMEDVKNYEPYIALSGGKDGLYFYKKIIEQSKLVLNDKGSIVFEIGYDQKDDVADILLSNGFSNIKFFKDLAGLDRVIKAEYSKE